MDKEWMAAFEKHRKKIYGRNPCPIDAITLFGAGWNAAVAAERERCAKIAETLKTLEVDLPVGADSRWERMHATKHGAMIAAAIRNKE